MKILAIDCRIKDRIKRVAAIAAGIRSSFPSIDIATCMQVDGSDNEKMTSLTDDDVAACKNHLKNNAPALILLHVGSIQSYAAECLTTLYKNHVVLCYTGDPIPTTVSEDCSISGGNPKHCCYPKTLTFGPTFDSSDAWRDSSEGNAILKFIAELEKYQNLKDQDQDSAAKILDGAKKVLQGITEGLEDVLNDLAGQLQVLLLKDTPPTQEELGNLAKQRDERLTALAAAENI